MLILLTFLFFTGLVGFLTWRFTRGRDASTPSGYFLAGRALAGGVVAGSLLLTNLSTEQLVGLNGAAFAGGLEVMAWEVIAALSLVVLALVFLPRYLARGVATVPQFLESRFDARTGTLIGIIFILAYALILLPIILYTGAVGLSSMLDLKGLTGWQSDAAVLWASVWSIGILGSLYAVCGGLRAIAVSDTLNGIGLLAGGTLITVYALLEVNPEGVLPALSELAGSHPEKFNSLGGRESSVPFSTLFTGVLLINLFYWTTNQQILQRAFGARSLKEGQKGVLIAGGFKILAPAILVLPGIAAFHLAREGGLEVDSQDKAYGALVREVLPGPLTGFFAAVVVGAVISSFNSVLNSTATLVSLDGTLGRWTRSRDGGIRSGRVCSIAVAFLAMSLAPLLDSVPGIFDHLQQMNALYFIPIFAVLLMGMFTRRVPAFAANTALVAGVAVIVAEYFLWPFWPWNNYHFLGAVFLALVAFMGLCGFLFPATAREEASRGKVDLAPWRWAWPVGMGLAAAVLLIYLLLADPSVLSSG